MRPHLPHRVVGLDLSLTSTGMSDFSTHRTVQTASTDPVEYRLDRLVKEAQRFVVGSAEWFQCATLVVIEAGAFSRNAQTGHEELAALRLMVRHRMWRLGVPFAMVPPTTLKLYTAGHGKASKQDMHNAIRERHNVDLMSVMVKDGRYDQVDAVALAAMGYARINQPMCVQGMPGPLASLNAVQWPDLITD